MLGKEGVEFGGREPNPFLKIENCVNLSLNIRKVTKNSRLNTKVVNVIWGQIGYVWVCLAPKT